MSGWQKPRISEVPLAPYVNCQKCNSISLAGVSVESIIDEMLQTQKVEGQVAKQNKKVDGKVAAGTVRKKQKR